MDFKPTTLNDRIDSLDIIRGFSLLGILLVNMFAFYKPLPHVDLHFSFSSAMDIIWHQRLEIYVQSSFYPLFAMLFGYGVAMQFIKAGRTGAQFYSFASKRFIILFILGMIHAFFIWWGDILATHAFCGFFLLMLIRFSPKKLLAFGLLIYIVMQTSMLVGYGAMGIANEEIEETHINFAMVSSSVSSYDTGNWIDTFNQRLQDLSVQMHPAMWIASLFTILPYMLVGAAFAKWQLIERAKQLKGLWLSIAIIGIMAGLFIKSTPYTFERTYFLEHVKVFIGGPILALGYMGLIVCICMIPFATKILYPLTFTGRMSLTIYIMQSIICTFIFYNYGFGLYGRISVQLGILIAIVIFIVQMIIAIGWFMKFKQGPLEAAVKKITYRKNYQKSRQIEND